MMGNAEGAVPEAIPDQLGHLIDVNKAYRVLICIRCRQAVRPSALDQHLRRAHKVARNVRKQVAKYIEGFPWDYEDSTVQLPDDGSEPQAVLRVIDGLECTRCTGPPFRTRNRQRWRAHGNAAHGPGWVSRKERPRKIRMQSWFWNGRERYWRVTGGTGGVRPGRESSAVMDGEDSATRVGEGRRRRRRRVTGRGVEGMAAVGGEKVTSKATGPVTANSGKRRASVEAGEDGQRKRVRFAGQVEIGGLDGLQQQLERWSKGCVVCYLIGGDEAAGNGRKHTIWECQQEVAEGVRADSREMEGRMRAVAAQGGCTGCRAPRTICERWQWGAQWEESTGGCQYEGVLISTMMAMAGLGRADGRRRVGEWLRRDGVEPGGPEEEVSRWFGRQIWWEGVEVGQVVLVFMMLARINGALREVW